jgi:hypothetical protein
VQAIADEDHWRINYGGFGEARAEQDVRADGEWFGDALVDEGRVGLVSEHTRYIEADGLEEPLGSGGLEAVLFEVLDDICCALVVAS